MFLTKHLIKLVLIFAVAMSAASIAHAGKKNSHLSRYLPNADDTFMALRDAARREDAVKANELASRLIDYPIPSYVDYYRLKARLKSSGPTEIRNFLERYNGTAIADRLRNDWLLNLGYQRQWQTFDEQYALYVVNDDIQVKCYALMSRALSGQNVAEEAQALLTSPKDYGEACASLLATLSSNGQFSEKDLWAQLRMAAEVNHVPSARRIAALLKVPSEQIEQAIERPTLALTRSWKNTSADNQIFIIALGRRAKTDHERAANILEEEGKRLSATEREIAWAQIALQASQQLLPQAIQYWRNANDAPASIEGHQWKVRIALREGQWKMVKAAIEAMPPNLRTDAAWIYWYGRALLAEGDAAQARNVFQSIASQTNFYGQLALEELGLKITVPRAPAPISETELQPMAKNPGFTRALKFFDMGLRFEGVREWNWELRKMSEREHLAAAEFARRNHILDRMVNTSDRTRSEVDFTQRFPSPFRDSVIAVTQKVGLDMAWVYGLIRQESRFVMQARSHVGASGLMQLMPETAKYVARKIGLADFDHGQVNEIDTNITLGTHYLNMVLNNLDGSEVMATAAYNAGPGRPRAWRATLSRPVEGAIFAESIPFSETRGYVKNVLSNTTYYAALFENKPQSLKARLGIVTPKGYVATDLP